MKTFMDLLIHAKMVADQERMATYQKAIGELVRPGDVVVDLGTGTGVLAAFACQAGARRVYAIERLPIIEVAKATLKSQGWQERVVFLEQDFAQADLPEKADVIVSEVLGSFGVGETSFADLLGCRERMLKTDGHLIPSRVRLFAAPVSTPDFYELISFKGTSQFGLDFSSARELALNQTYGHQLKHDQLMGVPRCLGEIDFAALNRTEAANLKRRIELQIEQDGELHAIAGWFEADLSPQTTLTNAPSGKANSWLHRLFPLLQPVRVICGDRVHLHLQMHDAGMAQFIWLWHTRVVRSENGIAREIANFQQNSFQGQLFSRNLLRVAASNYTPQLTAEGQLAKFVLEHCDGKHTEEDLIGIWNQRNGVCQKDAESEITRLQKTIERSWLWGDIA